MPAHNNAIQRPHLRKHYQKWIKTFFNQPAKKAKRINKRKEKAAKIFPRPLKSLKPTVSKCTVRYSGQPRLGRGFSLQELKKANINPQFARTIGISVDHRRTNKSEESLNRNVEKLKSYIDKLVLLPKKSSKPKKAPKGMIADSINPPQTVQNNNAKILANPELQLREKPVTITKEMKGFKAYEKLKVEMLNQKWDGKRKDRALKKEDN